MKIEKDVNQMNCNRQQYKLNKVILDTSVQNE